MSSNWFFDLFAAHPYSEEHLHAEEISNPEERDLIHDRVAHLQSNAAEFDTLAPLLTDIIHRRTQHLDRYIPEWERLPAHIRDHMTPADIDDWLRRRVIEDLHHDLEHVHLNNVMIDDERGQNLDDQNQRFRGREIVRGRNHHLGDDDMMLI